MFVDRLVRPLVLGFGQSLDAHCSHGPSELRGPDLLAESKYSEEDLPRAVERAVRQDAVDPPHQPLALAVLQSNFPFNSLPSMSYEKANASEPDSGVCSLVYP